MKYPEIGDVIQPQVGDITKASKIGCKGANGKHKYIYVACPDCGIERWVQLRTGKPQNEFCRSCWQKGQRNITYSKLGTKSPHWNGGRIKVGAGYIHIYVGKDNPFFGMTSRNNKSGYAGYVQEHRLVMAQHLGRSLTKYEHVHHINGDKQDNNIANLQLVNKYTHKVDYASAYRQGYEAGYRAGSIAGIRE